MGFKRKLNFLALQQRLQNKIDKEQEKLVIRMSMWDPVIRVYYDYRGRNNYRILEKEITASLKALKNDNA